MSVTTQWHAEAHNNSKAGNFSTNKNWRERAHANAQIHIFKHAGGTQINVVIEELQ